MPKFFKMPCKLLLVYIFLQFISSCSSYTHDSTDHSYTTLIRYGFWTPRSKPTFHVFHNGGKVLDECISEIEHFSKPLINVTIFSPCSYFREINLIWTVGQPEKESLVSNFREMISQIPNFLDIAGVVKEAPLEVEIILVPKNHTYHYERVLSQKEGTKVFVGVPVNLENWNMQDISNSGIEIIVHELIHALDVKNNKWSSRIVMEKIGYLAGHCASIKIGNYRKKKLDSSNLVFNESVLREIDKRNIADNEIEKFVRLDKLGDDVEQSLRPKTHNIVILSLQKALLKIVGSYDDNDMTDIEVEKVLNYCNMSLSSYFASP